MGPSMAAGAGPALGTGQPWLRPSAGTAPPGHGAGRGAERRPAAGGTPRPRPAGRHTAAPLSPAPNLGPCPPPYLSSLRPPPPRLPPQREAGAGPTPAGREDALQPWHRAGRVRRAARWPGARGQAPAGGQRNWEASQTRPCGAGRRLGGGSTQARRRLAGGRRARVPRSEQLAAPPEWLRLRVRRRSAAK